MTRAQQLAAIVRDARRRLFVCEAHQISRTSPETCELCILEQSSRNKGRAIQFRSITQIMGAQ
jgi:hypothetical protein